MRLFLYYWGHTIFNTLKRMMKTWLAILLVCAVMGGVIGLIIGTALPKNKDKDKKNDSKIESVEGVEEGDESSEKSNADEAATKEPKKEAGYKKALRERGISKSQVVDLVVSLVFFLQLAINITNSKQAGKIFHPGDVPMLFASPMRPQSVMMFRLAGSFVTSLILTLYMVFQLPNLIYNAKLGVWGAVSLIVAYGMSLMFGTLVQVTFYTITSRMVEKKVNINTCLMVFYGALLGIFVLYVKLGNNDLISSAFSFFANKKTFLVPFWGWLRAMCYYAAEGDVRASVIYLALFLLSCILLVIFIWNMKADFYEDALTETDKKASMMEGMKNAQKGGVITREKNRSAKMDREGFHHGFGASVFFHKAVFNRFRLSYFKLFSKTLLFYTVIAGLMSLLATKNDSLSNYGFLFPVCALGVMVFYRTLGNPLREDTTREFFVMVPASPLSKMWCSILGGLVVTALDLSIPMILAAVITKTAPLTVIGWFLFILSIDLFGTALGTFIDASVPGESGQQIKVVVQIFFLYFGMIPAAAFVFAGVILHMLPLMLLIGAIIDATLASLFIFFTPHFLVNR